MRITLIIHSLTCGGAERVMSVMANYWVGRGWHVSLLTFDDGMSPPFYDLDPRVHHSPLGIAHPPSTPLAGLVRNLRRVARLRQAIQDTRPDVVLSFLNTVNVLTLLSTRGLNIPVVISERVDPSQYSAGWVWDRMMRLVYPWADRLVVQTDLARRYFPATMHSRIRVIPNPVNSFPRRNPAVSPSSRRSPAAVAMGRLERQKGFDLLLRAFSKIADAHPQWTLTILGEGPLRKDLELLRDELNLSGRVFLPGAVKNPGEFIGSSDLFVLSSRFEGFPNALLEAMAAGLPVISFDCPSGPAEIIHHEINGVLVPVGDADSLASAMDRVMADPDVRQRLASGALEVVDRFGLEKVMALWESVLVESTAGAAVPAPR